MFCQSCGKELSAEATYCSFCGKKQLSSVEVKTSKNDINCFISSKSRLSATLLCFFLGIFGVHRFYVGKIGTGVLWLCTLGFLGIGSFIDLLLILTGNFEDKTGKILENW